MLHVTRNSYATLVSDFILHFSKSYTIKKSECKSVDKQARYGPNTKSQPLTSAGQGHASNAPIFYTALLNTKINIHEKFQSNIFNSFWGVEEQTVCVEEQ